MLKNFLLVGFGGAIGSMLRYGATTLVSVKYFPFATMAVNIIGSFVIGMVVGFSLKNEYFLTNWKLFLATGICGGFTTFSSFSAENLELLQSGRTLAAVTYIVISIITGIAAAFFGFKLLNT